MQRQLVFLLWIISLSSYGQVAPDKDRQVVLMHNRVGKTYIFDRSKPKDYNRTELTYLGSIRSRNRGTFKILTSRWYWGLSPRATSKIIIFNRHNKYLGEYYVGMTYDLPSRIERKALVFLNTKRTSCDPKLVTRVSLRYGLPKQFFLKCQGKYGDIYSFGAE